MIGERIIDRRQAIFSPNRMTCSDGGVGSAILAGLRVASTKSRIFGQVVACRFGVLQADQIGGGDHIKGTASGALRRNSGAC